MDIHQERIRRSLIENNQTRTNHEIEYSNALAELFAEARRALTFREIPREGGLEPIHIKKKAASLRTLNVTKTLVKIDANGNLNTAPGANMAGEIVPCSTAIVNTSRAAKAGANLIFLPEHSDPKFIDTGSATKVMYTQNFPRYFVNVDASEFAEIPDDADVPETVRPVFKGDIKPENLRQFSVLHRVNHKEQVDRGGQQVADEILAAIVAGVSRTADRVFIETVLAASPEAFSVGKAAAKGARFEQLRGLIGTDGTGAAFRADGQMIVNNVPAEITAASAESLIGWFERGAVVIGPDLQILAERLNVNGDLSVTCWFSLRAVIPDAASFWTVGA